MNLVHLYSQHKDSLRRAAAATSRLARTRYLAAADLFAHRIDQAKRAESAKTDAEHGHV